MGALIGLHRHRGTERPGTSVAALFSDLQAAVESRYRVRLKPWYGRLLSPAKQRAVEREFLRGCDLVMGTDGALLETRRALGLDVPVVLVAIGTLPRGDHGIRRAFPLLRPQDAVALSSEADRELLRLHLDVCPAEQALLPFGVDTDAFRPAPPEEREGFRRGFGIRSTDVLFLSVGRITAEKNVQSILTVLSSLVERRPNARLAIAGPFADHPFHEFGTGPFDLRALFAQILDARPALKARTIFLGEVRPASLPALYSAADVFINLTRHHDENFGYAQVEAMACGLPVIGSDWGGLKDTIRHGETGFKVPAYVTGRGIQLDLWRALQHCDALAASVRLRRRMGEAGRAVAEREYSLGRFRRGVLRLVERALRRPRDRAPGSVLSDFGRRFARAFGGLRAPVSPVFTPRTYPLYQELIRPYATGPLEVRPPPDGAVLFATPLSYRLRRGGVEVVDVTWPGRVRLSEGERALLRWYDRRAQPFVPVSEARRALAGELDRAILGLMRKGLILTSEPRSAADVAPAPVPEVAGR